MMKEWTAGGIRFGIADRIDACDKTTGEVISTILEDRMFCRVCAERKTDAPYNGGQDYIDPERGITYRLDIENYERLMAVYQHKNWWVRPSFPETLVGVPKKTQLLLIGKDDYTVALMAVTGDALRSDIEGNENGSICVRVSSNQFGCKRAETLSLVAAWGTDPYQAIAKAAELAAEQLGRPEILRRNKVYPGIFEKLGWCSWDAFYQQVNEEGIFEKMDELHEKAIPEGWILIDDGWSDADYRWQKLSGLDASEDKFPKGLAHCVHTIHGKYGIPHVGVWHALMGYWNGIEKDSAADRAFAGMTLELPEGRIMPAPDKGKAFAFFDTWHSYLRNHCGIDFVKVDGQSASSLFLRGRDSFGHGSRTLQAGLGASASMHFNGNIINCMGMAPEDMWNRSTAALIRTSDDFVPDVPHGFREHAIQNGFNSLWSGSFYYGDWDMFFSNHPEARQNSVLRAVSGGPVYNSDKVGMTDPSTILPLILADGTVIRCDEVGVPTMDCLYTDPVKDGTILKLFNRIGDSYVIAAFNIAACEKEMQGTVSTADIPGLRGREWILYDQANRSVFELSDGNEAPIHMEAGGASVYLLLPKKSIVPVGIAEKYISCGCQEVFFDNNSRMLIRTKDAGTFIFAGTPETVLVNGEIIEPEKIGACLYAIEDCREGDIIEILCKQYKS